MLHDAHLQEGRLEVARKRLARARAQVQVAQEKMSVHEAEAERTVLPFGVKEVWIELDADTYRLRIFATEAGGEPHAQAAPMSTMPTDHASLPVLEVSAIGVRTRVALPFKKTSRNCFCVKVRGERTALFYTSPFFPHDQSCTFWPEIRSVEHPASDKVQNAAVNAEAVIAGIGGNIGEEISREEVDELRRGLQTMAMTVRMVTETMTAERIEMSRALENYREEVIRLRQVVGATSDWQGIEVVQRPQCPSELQTLNGMGASSHQPQEPGNSMLADSGKLPVGSTAGRRDKRRERISIRSWLQTRIGIRQIRRDHHADSTWRESNWQSEVERQDDDELELPQNLYVYAMFICQYAENPQTMAEAFLGLFLLTSLQMILAFAYMDSAFLVFSLAEVPANKDALEPGLFYPDTNIITPSAVRSDQYRVVPAINMVVALISVSILSFYVREYSKWTLMVPRPVERLFDDQPTDYMIARRLFLCIYYMLLELLWVIVRPPADSNLPLLHEAEVGLGYAL